MTEAPAPTSDKRLWPVYCGYVVVLGMVICFAIIAIQFIKWIVPSWDARDVLLFCILAALEAVASFWLVKRLPTAERQILPYRITEWIIILIVLKFLTELTAGPIHFWNNLLLWPVNFPANFLTLRYILAALPVLVVWQVSNIFAGDLFLLGEIEVAYLDERTKTTPVRDLILRHFLNLGMAVVLLAGIPPQVVIQINLTIPVENVVPEVITYFILGMILLSLTRYTSLVANWHQSKVVVPVQVPRRWFTYSTVVLTGLILLVIWLPTNYGMGFFETFNAIIGLIYQVIVTVYALFIYLIGTLIRLLGYPMNTSQAPIPQATPAPNNYIPPNASVIDWNLIKSIFFWAILIFLVVVALRQYISFNQDLAEELKGLKPLKWLSALWNRFKAAFKKANKSVGTFVQSSIMRLRSVGKSYTSKSDWDFINPRRLNPRQKIIFYYLALIRRAGEAGLPRKDGQTPYEYAHSLNSSLEEGQDGIKVLTESFIEARYSSHNIPAAAAHRVETLWETIQRILRNVRRSRQEEKKYKGD